MEWMMIPDSSQSGSMWGKLTAPTGFDAILYINALIGLVCHLVNRGYGLFSPTNDSLRIAEAAEADGGGGGSRK